VTCPHSETIGRVRYAGASGALTMRADSRKWAAPRTVLARPSRRRAMSTSPVAARDREQGVIPAHAGVPVVESALLGQAIRLADRRVEIDRERRGPGSGTGREGPGQELTTDPVELANVAPAEAAQERAQGRGGLHHVAQDASRPAGPERVCVVDAVAPARADMTRLRSLSPTAARSAAPRGRGAHPRARAGRDDGRGRPATGASHQRPGDRRRRLCRGGPGCNGGHAHLLAREEHGQFGQTARHSSGRYWCPTRCGTSTWLAPSACSTAT
jgi:hypothetical protein